MTGEAQHATYLRADVETAAGKWKTAIVTLGSGAAGLMLEPELVEPGAKLTLHIHVPHGDAAITTYAEVVDRPGLNSGPVSLLPLVAVEFVTPSAHVEALVREHGVARRRKRRVVIVDDDKAQLTIMERTLTRLGMEIVAIDRPIGATSVIIRADPSLAIFDLAMPALDGRELCKLLRENPRTRSLPILLMSAQPAAELRAAVIEAGANGFIEKGADLAVVMAELSRYLQIDASDAKPAPDRSEAARLPLGPEKRRDRRYPFLAAWRVLDTERSEETTGWVANVSQGGVSMYLAKRLTEGATVNVLVPAPGGGLPSAVVARVFWSLPVGALYAAGLAFDRDDENGQEIVQRFVEAIAFT